MTARDDSCNETSNRQLINSLKALQREEVVMPRCHGSKIFWILTKRGPANMAEKPRNLICITFLCMIALMNKTVALTFLPSLLNANDFICQERLLRSRDCVTMVTWRHTFPLYWENNEYHVAENWISNVVKYCFHLNFRVRFVSVRHLWREEQWGNPKICLSLIRAWQYTW